MGDVYLLPGAIVGLKATGKASIVYDADGGDYFGKHGLRIGVLEEECTVVDISNFTKRGKSVFVLSFSKGPSTRILDAIGEAGTVKLFPNICDKCRKSEVEQ